MNEAVCPFPHVVQARAQSVGDGACGGGYGKFHGPQGIGAEGGEAEKQK